MDMQTDHGGNAGIMLTTITFSISIAHFAIAAGNRSLIAWGIGVMAGLFSMGAATMTIIEKHYSIKKLKKKD